MKNKTLLWIIGSLGIAVACTNKPTETKMESNPFLSEYGTPHEVPAFDKVKNAHFLPAFEAGIAAQKAEIETISNNTEAANFENTLVSLDASGQALDKVGSVFYNMLSMNTSDSLQDLAKTISKLTSAHYDDIMMNAKLFARVKTIFDSQKTLGLNTEQTSLLNRVYQNFVRNGALLDEQKKATLRVLNDRLATLGLEFGDNQLAEVNAWQLVLDKESDLEGLPQGVREAAASTAKEAGLEGKWVITLQKPSWIPFLQYSTRRDLREKVYKAWMNQANNDNKNDNKKILATIATLRNEKAKLLGFSSWAAYGLDDTMAKNIENVNKLLKQVWDKALPMAKIEAAEMQKMMAKDGLKDKLASWDWWFYAEKIRKAKYNFDEEAMRPYFELNKVRDGLFDVLGKLFGLKLIARTDLPKPHADAQAFEVQNTQGQHIGILYMDFYPRASKRAGAWMSEYRKQWKHDGKMVTPVITTVFNFTKPSETQPALLTMDEVSTMYHEMGHALHGLLSNCTYRQISGTDVARDFVELPSQIMENWASETSVLKQFGKHYKTGEMLPDSLIERMKSASKFNQGFATVEYLAASVLDMDWHSQKVDSTTDVNAFETASMKRLGLIETIIPRYRSTYFSHIFAGGYSAGYYSYIWAEVLDADAFEAFRETGNIFDPAKAKSFLENILSRGASDAPMKLYDQFRGKQPTIEPLLRRRGLM